MSAETIYQTPGEPLPFVLDHVGERRYLGCLPCPPGRLGLPRYGDTYPVVPRDQWKPISFAAYLKEIWNQGQHGSCVWHGSGRGMALKWAISGQTKQDFSPTFGYALGNGGRDAGMNISTALDILTKYGNCLASEFPEGHIWKQDIPSQAYETAKRFRVTKAYHAGSFDELASGLQRGHIPVYGIYVGGDFGDLDGEGVAPAHRYSANHCMHGEGLVRLPSGRWAIENVNSWGESWGDRGRCKLVESHFGSDCDAYLIVDVSDDPRETNVPPPLA